MKVGIDILENSRLEKMLNNSKSLLKVFTPSEISYFNKFSEKLTHITGNFCAKEAFVKALKTGFSGGLTPIDVEVLHTENGLPYINVDNPKIKALLQENEKIEISISHSLTTSTAICIIYG